MCSASAVDAAYFEGRYYVASESGGIVIYDENFQPSGRLTTLEGLPENKVTCLEVFRDALFIGCAEQGLAAFSGGKLTLFSAKRPQANQITCLAASADALYAGTFGDGVYRFDGSRVLPIRELAGLKVRSLAATRDAVAAGTFDSGVFLLRGKQVEQISGGRGLPSQTVLGLAPADDGFLAATPLGAFLIRPGWRCVPVLEGKVCLSVAPVGNETWVGTLGEGLFIGQRRSESLLPADARVNRIRTCGRVTFVLTGDGAYATTPAGMKRLPDAGDLPAPFVTSLATDGHGTLYVGTFEDGILVWEGGKVRRHIVNDRCREVNCLSYDSRDGTLLAGTSKGLVFIPQNGRQYEMTSQDGLAGDNVSGIWQEGDDLFCAIADGGLSWIRAGATRNLSRFQGLASNRVYACAAFKGAVYAGTLAGLSVISDGRVKETFTTANSPLKAHWITALLPAGDSLWVGTYGGGLYRFSPPAQWKRFEEACAFEVNVNALFAFRDRILAGTLGRGICAVDRESGTAVYLVRRLPSRNVTAFCEDSGYLYCGTECGMLRVSLDALDDTLR